MELRGLGLLSCRILQLWQAEKKTCKSSWGTVLEVQLWSCTSSYTFNVSLICTGLYGQRLRAVFHPLLSIKSSSFPTLRSKRALECKEEWKTQNTTAKFQRSTLSFPGSLAARHSPLVSPGRYTRSYNRCTEGKPAAGCPSSSPFAPRSKHEAYPLNWEGTKNGGVYLA